MDSYVTFTRRRRQAISSRVTSYCEREDDYVEHKAVSGGDRHRPAGHPGYDNSSGIWSIVQLHSWRRHKPVYLHECVRELVLTRGSLPGVDERFPEATHGPFRRHPAPEHGQHEPARVGMVPHATALEYRIHNVIPVPDLQHGRLFRMWISSGRPG